MLKIGFTSTVYARQNGTVEVCINNDLWHVYFRISRLVLAIGKRL